MKIFATRWFARFARKESIPDQQLREAIARAEKGAIDAELGGGLIKQRVARDGGGKSGGYRTIVAYHSGTRSIFLYGFAKNVRDNIAADDLALLKKLSKRFLSIPDEDLERALAEGELIDVGNRKTGKE
ncbi:type II toxin-antitoxin system RelE/ParE family toxin [Methylocystis sp. JR02]|uniref:type II toxin-antitoxin system RelE/ParE family toxin n=1 Tax=Methylocystis sp. JR02 TaxID=3046284 RepID=UPI0024B88103|nr:type II toxin-antitoxin system RelE/ParE family toxin [Methylocystis sp. JR02]MDJ0448198.1 type II toxin-antitoxin system RelE/ParE family toxin [Methylocystis sp. JR02]